MKMKPSESFFENVGLNFLLNLHFKVQRFNVVLHSFVHDIWEYNKTLSRRKPHQMRESLRNNYFYDQSNSDLDNSYMSVLNYYRSKEEVVMRQNNNPTNNCKCGCHKILQIQTGNIDRKSDFHNVFCISNCESSNVSYRNYLISKNISSSKSSVTNYSDDRSAIDSPSLGGNTFVAGSSTFYSSINDVFLNLKSAITPKIKQLLKFHDNYHKILNNNKKLRFYKDIEIIHSPAMYIQQQNRPLQLFGTSAESNNDIFETSDTVFHYSAVKNTSLIETQWTNSIFKNHYRIDIISRS